MFRLKSGHNLLPAYKSKYDLATPSNYVTCEMPLNEHHLLFECKNHQLLQTNLKAMITNNLSFQLGTLEAALEIRYILYEFLIPYVCLRFKRYIYFYLFIYLFICLLIFV